MSYYVYIQCKQLKYKRENKGINIFKENLLINSPLSVIFSKLTKNFKNPKILFHSFDKKIVNMLKLLNKQISGFDKKDKEIIKIRKENLINQLNIIKNNSSLIKKYYRNSCLELKNELKLDIDKYDYL